MDTAFYRNGHKKSIDNKGMVAIFYQRAADATPSRREVVSCRVRDCVRVDAILVLIALASLGEKLTSSGLRKQEGERQQSK